MTLFNPIRYKSQDGAYEFYLNSEYQQDVRNFVDQMYAEVQSYIGDPNFEEMLQTDFHATVWQLYVAWTFLKYGRSKLVKSSAEGPDIVLEDGTIIEAVTAKRGIGPDKPNSLVDEEPIMKTEFGAVYGAKTIDYPDPKIILRITNAIQSKIAQHERWLREGVVRPEQPFVIAVNAGLLEMACESYGHSYVTRVAFALGADLIVVPINFSNGLGDFNHSHSRIDHRPYVTKQSGNNVRSDLFLHDGFSRISGLLFSAHHIGNFVDLAPKDLEYVSNGFARNVLPRELLLGIRYTWAEIDSENSVYKIFTEPKPNN